MNRKQLLFVTYLDEQVDEGISYAIDLARAMVEDIVLLLVRKEKTISGHLNDLMAGVAFAEAGDPETAVQVAAGNDRDLPELVNRKITEMIVASSKAGVQLEVRNAEKDLISGIRTFLKGNRTVDKVVLSPAVTESEALTTRDLNRLVRTASRPIVTMTKQSVRAMKESSQSVSYGYEPSTSY